MKILIVDENPSILELLTEFLTYEGHAVEEAENGHSAWSKFSNSFDAFDLVLADIHMPQLDGLSLLKKIRSHHQHQPVILMSSYLNAQITSELSQLKVTVLHKPFRLESLAFALASIEERLAKTA